MENLNPNIIEMEYAVRGPLVIRAVEIEKELERVSGDTVQILISAQNIFTQIPFGTLVLSAVIIL